MQLPEHFFTNRKLDQLVENKTSYTIDNAQLNVYETHHYAEKVILQFSEPVLASMLEGKKVMHLRDTNSFNFFPGESLTLPADEVMCIDFPEAKEKNPTRCLAMQLDSDMIKGVIDEMNETIPKADEYLWRVGDDNFVFTNDNAVHHLLQRLIYLFMEDHKSKDYFVQLILKELIIRIKQTENTESYHNHLMNINSSSRMAFIIKHIREHLSEDLNVSVLAEKANMSEPSFHRIFKNETGISPIQFINQSRIKKATAMLKNSSTQMKEVYSACGFNNVSYFNRIFRKLTGDSPTEYQRKNQIS